MEGMEEEGKEGRGGRDRRGNCAVVIFLFKNTLQHGSTFIFYGIVFETQAKKF